MLKRRKNEKKKRNIEKFCYRKYKNPYALDIWHQQQNNNNHNNDEKLFILNFRFFAFCSQGSHLLVSMNWTRGKRDACHTAGQMHDL